MNQSGSINQSIKINHATVFISINQATVFMNQVELMTCLQSLVAMTAECCRLSSPGTTSPRTCNLASEKLQLFSRELARRVKSVLDWTKIGPDAGLELLLGGIRLPWLSCLVCEHLLEPFDESLLPLISIVDDR